MNTKSGVVFLEIRWVESVERIRLDLAAFKDRVPKRLCTEEIWKGEERPVSYNPRFHYVRDSHGDYHIELTYVPHDHPKLQTSDVPWGRSSITIKRDLTSAKARWESSPANKDQDGGANRCKISIERPSATKQQVISVRKAQGAFKNELLKRSRCCEISGETLLALLDAAHVLSVENNGPDVPENGLLLRTDLHRLFDSGYFSIKSNGRLKLHSKLPSRYVQQLTRYAMHPSALTRVSPYLNERNKLMK